METETLFTQEQVRQYLIGVYGLKEYSLRSAQRWLEAHMIPNRGPSRKLPRYQKHEIDQALGFHVPKGYEIGKVLTVKAATAARKGGK